jgi:putative ABC transport system ATP-binding protein
VTKVYPSEPPVTALRGMSFKVDQGELVAIVGPSGSGKTTLLHLMGTLDRPTTGAVRLTGLDAATMTDRELAALRATRIGFVFQQFFLNGTPAIGWRGRRTPLLRGLPARPAPASWTRTRPSRPGRTSRRPPHPAVRRSASTGGHRPGHRGSPGHRAGRRATGNLDQATGESILSLFHDLNEVGVTIVVITHDRDIAGRLPRHIEMLDGRIVADTTQRGSPVSVGTSRLHSADTQSADDGLSVQGQEP